jgi:Nif-specific regulatory protein
MAVPYPLIRVETGPHAGREVPVSGKITIGRGEDCDLRLIDEKISRKHATLEPRNADLHLQDLGSVNGTLVRGKRIAEVLLQDGEKFRIGDAEIVFRARPEAERTTKLAQPEAATPEKTSQVDSVLSSAESDLLAQAPDVGQVSSVYRLVRDLPGDLDAQTLARKFLLGLIAELQAESGAVLLRTAAGTETVIAEPGQTQAPALSRTIIDRVFANGEALLVSDLEGARAEKSASLSAARVASLAAAPIPVSEGRALVYLDRRRDKRPFSQNQLRVLAEAARAMAHSLTAAQRHADDLARVSRLVGSGTTQIIGNSPNLLTAVETALRVAPYTTSVLIGGPTGSGKELLARLIHENSPRAQKPFIAVNCAALPEGLQESELFGHERGAFTGAAKTREGLFKLADGGTLFLDEVGDLAVSAQVKLLRAVETGEFYPVGSEKTLSVDVRILAATNLDFGRQIESGKFRGDLYHRLNVVRIDLPALCERPSDIRLLALHFLQMKRVELKKPVQTIAERALTALENYAWPGNVRELANLIERAIVLTKNRELGIDDFPAEITQRKPAEAVSNTPLTLAEAERRAVLAALSFTQWQKTKAAEILGVSWPTLQKKIADYGLTPPKET